MPLNEPLFATFFLLAITLLLRRRWFWAVLVFNAAHMVRMESWYSFPIIGLFVLLRSNITVALLFSLSYFSYPLWWMKQNLYYKQDALYFLHERSLHVESVGRPYHHFSEAITRWLKHFVEQLGVLQTVLLFIASRNLTSEGFFAAGLSLYLLILLMVQILTGSMEWFPTKYVYVPILLILPLAAQGLLLVWQKNKMRPLIVGLCLIAAATAIAQNYGIRNLTFTTPTVTKVISQRGINTITYFYPKGNYPYDVYTTMYYANTPYFRLLEVDEAGFDLASFPLISEGFVVDSVSLDRFFYNQSCPRLVPAYRDNRYTYFGPAHWQ